MTSNQPAPTPQSDNGPPTDSSSTIDAIEFQTAVLVRNLELLRRRGDFYREVDRSGYLLLRTLQTHGPTDIATLASRLGLEASTTARQVSTMHTAGLVDRSPASDDRRRSIVTPTARGRDAMHAVLHRRWHGTADILAGWTDDDLHTLATMFTRYNRAIADQYLTPRPGID